MYIIENNKLSNGHAIKLLEDNLKNCDVLIYGNEVLVDNSTKCIYMTCDFDLPHKYIQDDYDNFIDSGEWYFNQFIETIKENLK
jgi:hypothetical protein